MLRKNSLAVCPVVGNSESWPETGLEEINVPEAVSAALIRLVRIWISSRSPTTWPKISNRCLSVSVAPARSTDAHVQI